MDTGGAEGAGRGGRSEKLSPKNGIKYEKGGPLDFLKNPSIPLKEFRLNPKDPPGFPTTVYQCTEPLYQKNRIRLSILFFASA
jgi:hypothetical protein